MDDSLNPPPRSEGDGGTSSMTQKWLLVGGIVWVAAVAIAVGLSVGIVTANNDRSNTVSAASEDANVAIPPILLPSTRSPTLPSVAPSTSAAPSSWPSLNPSNSISLLPSQLPTNIPTKGPSTSSAPSSWPSLNPSDSTSLLPSQLPTSYGTTQVLSTLAPTVDSRENLIASQLLSSFGVRILQPGTAYNRATIWIISEDARLLNPEEESAINQRFLVALFYFDATANEELLWRSCNPPLPVEGAGSDCIFQQALGRQSDGSLNYVDKNATRWLSDKHECTFAGVACDASENVMEVELIGQDIRGTLPSELALLPFLEVINLSFNKFTGTLPTEYAAIQVLMYLDLRGNAFLTGSIPDVYWEVSTLKLINVGENALTGTLSTKVGQLTQLWGLFTFDNLFEGAIPSEMGQLSFLQFARLHRNNFSGSIPTEVGNLSELRELWVHRNEMTGPIPSEIGQLMVLDDLRLHENDLTGNIPEELYNCAALSHFVCSAMPGIVGTISSNIGNLRLLKFFRMSNTNLTGTIPTELGSLLGLRLVLLNHVRLSGTMPTEVCSIPDLDILITDCNPTLETPPEVLCDCCTTCCDATALCVAIEKPSTAPTSTDTSPRNEIII